LTNFVYKLGIRWWASSL